MKREYDNGHEMATRNEIKRIQLTRIRDIKKKAEILIVQKRRRGKQVGSRRCRKVN